MHFPSLHPLQLPQKGQSTIKLPTPHWQARDIAGSCQHGFYCHRSSSRGCDRSLWGDTELPHRSSCTCTPTAAPSIGCDGGKGCCREKMLLSASPAPSTFTAPALGRDKFPAHSGFPCGNGAIKQKRGSLHGASFSAPCIHGSNWHPWVCSHHREVQGKGRDRRSCPRNTAPLGCRSVIPA